MYLMALLAAVAGLGDDDYDVREAGQKLATRIVRNHPRETHPVVCWAAGYSPSAEVRSRAARLTGHWPAVRAQQYRPGGVPVWPDIDRLACDSPYRGDVGGWKAAADNHPGPWAKPLWYPYYHRDRRAFELMIRALIRAGDLDECQADALVWGTWQNERAVFADCPQVRALHDAWERAGWTDGYPRDAERPGRGGRNQ